MASKIYDVSGALLDRPYKLWRFDEKDSNDVVAAVPGAVSKSVQLVNLSNTDIVTDFDLEFNFITSGLGAYTGAITASPWFPYNFVQKLLVPFQTRSFPMGDMDGHLWAITNWLRQPRNAPYRAKPYVSGQAALLSTGYETEQNLLSSGAYAWPAASTAAEYKFGLNVPAALYFKRFYDEQVDKSGKTKYLCYDDCYVSPLLMSSTGRNVLPTLMLNPTFGGTVDIAPGAHTGATSTLPVWTDNGSTVAIRRRGWRQPPSNADFPPLFNWQHNWYLQRYNLPSAKLSKQALPVEGQVLSVIGRLFDPNLDSPVGDAIDINNLVSLSLATGNSNLVYEDTPQINQKRLLQQHGQFFTKGVFGWDLYADTESNLDAIDTYKTAGVNFSLDFTGTTPGPGSYVDVLVEFLSVTGSGR